MEAFIRDKYENRRYITAENGGLGGAAPSRPGMGSHNIGGPPQTRNMRPAQHMPQHRAYDRGGVGAPASSRSYAARFGAPPAVNTRARTPSAVGADAVARATTLRELVKMGFPTQLALRAVEASQGDMQRAVDWVLQNSDGAQAANPMARPAPPPVPTKPVEQDLLFFGDESSSQPAPTPAAPKAKAASPPSHVPDFADFGDFESALPASKPINYTAMAASTSSPAGKTMLSHSLADLYKQPGAAVAKAASPSGARLVQNSIPQGAMNPLQLSKTSATALAMATKGQSTARSAMTTASQAPVSNGTAEGSKMGMPVFEFETAKASKATVGAATNSWNKQPQKAMARPSPPPMQESVIMGSENGPPSPSPPSSKPPLQNDATNDAPPGLVDNNTVDDDQASDVNSGEQEQEVQEDEDPFAALSMMALSSASVSKKKAAVVKKEIGDVAVTKTTEAATTLADIDDLLDL